MLNFQLLEQIKKLSIIAIFSNDLLMNRLVLKGGNCIDIAYKLSTRSSLDIDFSMENDFTAEELAFLRENIHLQFDKIFSAKGFKVFDTELINKPKDNPRLEEWSGYQLSFKVIEQHLFEKLENNIEQARKQSLNLSKNNSKTFKIDISKYEYCKDKEAFELNGVLISIYSATMTVFEKLRALCQKMEEYELNFTKKDLPRARDFYDIFIVNEELAKIDFKDLNNRQILKEIFEAKKVPLKLLEEIKNKKEVHKLDFDSVRATITHTVEPFDFYFDYVLDLIEQLDKFWEE